MRLAECARSDYNWCMTHDSDDNELHPRLTHDVYGHTEVERLLLADFNRDKLPGAYMFCGARGVGKATMAYRLATFLLATPSPHESAGGLFGDALPPVFPESLSISAEHPAARRVAAGSHGNVLVVERSVDEKSKKLRSEIVVEDARKIGAFLSKSAGEGGWRVVIIDTADEMNNAAANAILKWLEEPPERAIFILIAHHPGKLLPTIRSRCRSVVFRPPSHADFARIICAKLGELEPEDIDHLYYLSGGAPGWAVTLYESGAVEAFEEIIALFSGNAGVQALEQFAEQLAARKKEMATSDISAMLLSMLAGIIRSIQGALRDTPPREQELFARMAAKKPLDYWLELWEKGAPLLASAEQMHLDTRVVTAGVLTALAGQDSILHYINNEA